MLIGTLMLRFGGPAILLVLAAIFFRRKLYQEFPFFFSYIAFSVTATIARQAVLHNPLLYFWVYWITEGFYDLLALLVLREVFHRIFMVVYAAYRWFRLVLPITVALISGLTVWEAIRYPFAEGYVSALTSGIYWFDLGVHLLEGVILLVLLGIRTIFPISWRQYEFGILAGFGINASITMTAYLIRFEWGKRYDSLFHYGLPVGYLLATLIWLHAFLRPPESVPRGQIGHEEMLAIVRRYREMLEKIEKALGLRRQLAPSA